jgi:hypothetical protein
MKLMGKYGDPPKDVSELTYGEVIDQLQILEYIELNKRWEYDDDCRKSVKELQHRERDLLRQKTLQFFVTDNLGSRDAWTRACNNPDFIQTAFHLASRHLLKDAELAERQQQDLKTLGDFPELQIVRAREKDALARKFDEDRGQLAREFLNSREPAERAQTVARVVSAQGVLGEPANDDVLQPDEPEDHAFDLLGDVDADDLRAARKELEDDKRRTAQDADDWARANDHPEFQKIAKGLIERQRQERLALDLKYQEQIQRLGPAAIEFEVSDLTRKFDKERGRYAREFLDAREIQQQLEERDKQKTLDPGKEPEL